VVYEIEELVVVLLLFGRARLFFFFLRLGFLRDGHNVRLGQKREKTSISDDCVAGLRDIWIRKNVIDELSAQAYVGEGSGVVQTLPYDGACIRSKLAIAQICKTRETRGALKEMKHDDQNWIRSSNLNHAARA